MVFRGNTGSGTPTAGTEEGAGSEQGGSAQGGTGKQVTHVLTAAQRWQGMSQRNPSQSGGTPNSTPVPLGRPSRLAFVRSGAGALGEPLAPVRTATCQSHFLKQTTIRGGTATRGHRPLERGPATAPQLCESAPERTP